MHHRDIITIKHFVNYLDIEGEPSFEPDKLINATVSPSGKLVKNTIHRMEHQYLEADVKILTKETIKIQDQIIYNGKMYKIISSEEQRPQNKRLKSEWIAYAQYI